MVDLLGHLGLYIGLIALALIGAPMLILWFNIQAALLLWDLK